MPIPDHPHHRRELRLNAPFTVESFFEHCDWRRVWLEVHVQSKAAGTRTPHYRRLTRVVTRVTGTLCSPMVPRVMLAETTDVITEPPTRKGMAISHPRPPMAIGEWVLRCIADAWEEQGHGVA